MRHIICLLLIGLCFNPAAKAQLATAPESIRTLPAGIQAPNAPLQDIQGKTTDLQQARANKASLVVFYRGGWCPFCNLQLSELRHLQPLLKKHNIQLLAISPDSPAALRKTLDKNKLPYQLLSDSSARLMQAFGIGFKVDAKTLEKFREYGIDLELASGGEKHHGLPVPSVFLIDEKGVIQFVYSNPDYRTRVPKRLLEAALDAMVKGEFGQSIK